MDSKEFEEWVLMQRKQDLHDWARFNAVRDLLILLTAESRRTSVEAVGKWLDDREALWRERLLMRVEDDNPAQAAQLDDDAPLPGE